MTGAINWADGRRGTLFRLLERFGNRLAQVSGNPLPQALPTALPLGQNHDS
ncbi:MAG: hypothetical protein ACRDIC_08115 [bacterium]